MNSHVRNQVPDVATEGKACRAIPLLARPRWTARACPRETRPEPGSGRVPKG
jgi:hypothetical protein